MSRQTERTDILGAQISAVDMNTAVETIEGWIENDEKHYVCISNVYSVMEGTRDPEYQKVLNESGMTTPDGMPLVWLSRRAGKHHVERVCGPDLMPLLASRSGQTGHRHFFYGGSPGVADELAQRLCDDNSGLQIAGTHTPGMLEVGEIESEETIAKINATNPDIVWVGLGGPKQDFWVRNHVEHLDASVLIAVGAAFDFHSGRVKRAPKWMQKRGLEWLYRLSQDPRRLWRRYIISNAMFVAKYVSRLTVR